MAYVDLPGTSDIKDRQRRRRRPGTAIATIACLAILGLTTLSTGPANASGMTRFAADQPLPAGVDAKTGFRMHRYRGPTPAALPGGVVVTDAWMRENIDRDDLRLIDVFPPKGLGPDPLDGSWRHSEPRESIAGATWLPETGRGHLESDALAYLERNLARLSAGNRATPFVFFCTADCWQGWNAARRAILLGYTNVHWYPNGTDGWIEHGESVTTVEPVNFLGQP